LSVLPSGNLATRRLRLLQGASLGALSLAAPQAGAAPFRSLNQALALSGHAAASVAAPAAGITAARSAQLGVQNLAAASARFQSLSQSLARVAGTASLPVADGIAPGGLQILTADGATGPVQQPGTYDVTVDQTQALARLTWQTFNVGAHTKLTFDQSAGGTQAGNWVVINTVEDPLANPTQILGTIAAPGRVYVLNRNGIAFGNGASINVGALVAATASIAQAQFGTDATGLPTFSLYGAQAGSTFAPTFVDGGTGAITVAAGATIETPPPAAGARGGSVMLLGANVDNEGVIGTPQGQTVLAAGTQFTLRQGSQGSTTTGNTTSTTLGSEVAALNVPVQGTGGATPVFTTGAVANGGIVVADQGDISLVGQAITQSGVLLSTTTVNTRGTIHLLTPTNPTDPGAATSGIVLAGDSVTEILPEDDGTTALDSQRAADVAASAVLNAQRVALSTASATNPQLADRSLLADQAGESRIELSSGGTVDLRPGALAITPGGQVAIGAAGGVLVEGGATIDVSGSTDAVLPASVNDLLVNVQPYQLRDSAANRTGGLKSTNVNIDARTLVEIAAGAYGPTAANPLGNIYTPGGLFEVGGYLGLVPHGINEWTAIGGQVTLQAGAGAVTTQPGSVINLTGGIVTYAAGLQPQTYVQTVDGQVFDANTAPGNLVYAGLYTGQDFSQPRWHVQDTYANPLLTPATVMDPSYVVGRDAGVLTVSAGTAVLGGTIAAGVTLGQNQDGARPAVVSDPYLLAQNVVPLAGALRIGDYATGELLGGIASPVAFEAPGATAAAGTLRIDASQLDAAGLARITVSTVGDIAVDAPIAVADGGAISLSGSTIEVASPITARGGAITLSNFSAFNGAPLAPPTPATPGNIALASGAVLDARGVWTNAVQTPQTLSGEALVDGGQVILQGVGGVQIAAGARIDVSSGGAILQAGRALSGAGGDVTVAADLDTSNPTAPPGNGTVVLDGAFDGVGSKGGGTLSLTAPGFLIGGGAQSSPAAGVVALGQPLFASGFARYVIDGTASLAVLPGTQLTVAEPIYEPAAGLAVPTGGDPSRAYTVVLPTLFTPVRGSDTATQRAGASISLLSDTALGSLVGAGGSIDIGAGARVAVDPGQSIVVAGRGQVTVDGALVAHAGTVEVASTLTDGYLPPDNGQGLSNYRAGLSVWLGGDSTIDVSGQANLFTDALGRRFGTVSAGGLIELGGYGGLANANSTLAQVIERPGAVLDADGAAATVDAVAGDTPAGPAPGVADDAPMVLASAGGAIVARSIAGIALDGAFTARAGGAGAAGGAIVLSIDPIDLPAYHNIPTGLYQPSQVVVSQATQAVQPADLQVGQATADDTFALGRLSQAQITAGGFDQVSLSGADFVTFAGDVSLSAARAITLSGSVIGADSAGDVVGIAAPYVKLAGFAGFPGSSAGNALLSAAPTQASLAVRADLLDVQDALDLGGTVDLGTATLPDGVTTLPAVSSTALGFATTVLASTGDMRFLGQSGTQPAYLASQGDITLRAAQIYPASGQSAAVYAGLDPFAPAGTNPLGGGVLTVQGLGGAPAAPYSVGGALALVAGTVVQDGVVRAPQGSLRLGWTAADGLTVGYSGGDGLTSAVTLGAGSVTSVSLIGQTIPYGGTVDGVNYLLPANTGAAVGLIQSSLEVHSQSLVAAPGSVIDLRGGGTLAGAGFIAGRGGSADVLRTPLLSLSGGATVALGLAQAGAVQPAGLADPVFAILPGYQSGYAPAAGAADAGYSVPGIGERITVGDTVPGLAAGTYTLLPASYALLPGGFRVELTAGTLLAGSAVALGNFSFATPVTTGIAGTDIAADVPQAAIFTSGAGVRQLSQYDEETYNTFEAQTGTQFGAPRPALPQDAKTLVLDYPALPGAGPALSVPAASLLQAPDPVLGGTGLTVEVTSAAPIDVTGPGDLAAPGAISLPAAALSALAAPRLVLGGTIFVPPTTPDEAQVTGTAPAVTIMPHAELTAGDVMLTASGSGAIDVQGGAVVSTIGAGPAATDLSGGFYFTAGTAVTYPVLDVSNGQDVFLPSTVPVAGASITVGDGASLLAGGSLNVIAPTGTTVGIGAATLGGKYVSLSVSTINIGALPAGSAATLPTGLDLSPASLATLLDGNPAAGVPAASQLTLTATQNVNILGSAALDTRATALVLNTPAIYGYGNASDVAQITAPSFTWNGVQTQTGSALVPQGSAVPGGQIAGSAANVTGALVVSAQTIVLGYGPQTQPDGQTALDRVLGGFAEVTLQAGREITANNTGALSVFATQAQFGQPGTGGDLTLSTPLLTTDAAAVLRVTAGGALTLTAPTAPAATAGIATLGGEIDLTAQSIDLDTAVALPAGRLTLTAQDDITLGAAAHIDLSGRATPLFDQVALSPGGALVAESTAGDITEAPGALIDISAVAAPGAQAGSADFSALAGAVSLGGALSGGAIDPAASGQVSVITGTLPGFDALNAALDQGGVFGARAFEVASGDITIDTTLRAHTVSVSADSGSIDLTGTIDASGTTPGAIDLAAGRNLTLGGTAVLDAHATQTAVDSYGQKIDAENRAHVALTATAGVLTLDGGTIDVGYPGQAASDALHPDGDMQGEVSLYAPRLDAAGNAGTDAGRGYGDVALSVVGTPKIVGAASIALYATATYVPTDALGTIGQGSGRYTQADATVTLSQIDADNTAFIAGFAGIGAARLGGLAGYGAIFHVRPGVVIDSSAATGGDLTIAGDLDFSGLRYASGAGYGTPKTDVAGSGEPGSIVFRAANQLTVNGSVSDGFAAPHDGQPGTTIPADDGWVFVSPKFSPAADPLGADVILPSSLTTTTKAGTKAGGVTTTGHQIVLGGSNDASGVGTTFDISRAIALNYDITIAAAYINQNTVVPFAVTLGGASDPIPQGGFVATAPVTDAAGHLLFAQGAVIPGGTVLAAGDTLGRGSVLPVQIEAQDGTAVPAGTLLNIFAGDTLGNRSITLFDDTAPLPVGALIPANTAPVFLTPDGHAVAKLDLRPVETVGGDDSQGQIYPLGAMLPAGALSWNLGFVAGANQAAADTQAVLPRTVLGGGALAVPAATPGQAPGSLILADQHDFKTSDSAFTAAPAFSVIRTGTGDLDLAAGGDVDQTSLYGIYTAGTQTSLGSPAADAPYQTPRNFEGADKHAILPGNSQTVTRLNRLLDHTYAAYYPNGGGDLTLLAQGSLTSDQLNLGGTAPASDGVGNWLWRQGGAGLNQLGAWWINPGTVVSYTSAQGTPSLQLVGFEGIGTLGGGNVSVQVDGNAGQMTARGDNSPLSSEALVVAVGGTGRVLASGGIVLTGGGTETVRVGGALNPLDVTDGAGDATNGDFIDVRGDIAVEAGSVGSIVTQYPAGTGAYDPRALDPFTPDFNGAGITTSTGGPNVVPGDGTVQIDTLRDLVLGGAGDPGRVAEVSTTYVHRDAIHDPDAKHATATGGQTGFSLWAPTTAIGLFSAGGDVTPTTQPLSGLTGGAYAVNDAATDYRFVYPANLFVTAATGSIVYGSLPTGTATAPSDNNLFGLETAPSPTGEVSFLAGTSIFANGFAIDMSGAAMGGLPTPFDPAYTATATASVHGKIRRRTITDIRGGQGTDPLPTALFALEADTPTGDLHAADPVPARFYAAGGDIVNLVSGQTITYAAGSNETQPWYLAAKPVRILAGQDIVSSGSRPDAAAQGIQQNQQSLPQFGSSLIPTASGDVFLNDGPQSISVVSAGRDILSGYFYVGGPGLLEVDAGRNLFAGGYTVAATQLLDFGAVRSLGPLLSGTQAGTTGGADLAVLAGIGTGADYAAFAALYFDPANQANLALPITDPANQGKVQQTYADQLTAWLAADYPTVSLANGPLAAFRTLPQVDQDIFVRQVFFEETLASGRQFNDPASRFFGSYARGRLAIDTLFPSAPGTQTSPGTPAGYAGAITMLSGPVTVANGPLLADSAGTPLTYDAGISTQGGGTVQVLDPGGQVLLGTAGGAAPGAGSGIVGNGVGDIDIYADDSVLLGRSRIFTTGGGSILVWSSQGDINAGIGARTTVVYTPPTFTYDATGAIDELAAAPTNGAGIATLQPLPGVPPGDVDLIAPLGTIDAGEAGIRVAGNLNLAAARLANTANITVGGKTTGNAAAASVSLGAVEAAGAAAGSATDAAQTTNKPRAAEDQPSVIEVEVVGGQGDDEDMRKRRHKG
jgi:filamentous hemagglutinin family protein